MVRKAVERDVPRLVEASLAFPHYIISAEAVEPIFGVSIEQGACFLAERDGAIVGFIVGVVGPNAFSGRTYLDVIAFWVVPEHRATGAALKLLRCMLRFQWTEPLELVKIALADERLGRYLQREGFHPVEVTYLKGSAWQQRLAR